MKQQAMTQPARRDLMRALAVAPWLAGAAAEIERVPCHQRHHERTSLYWQLA